MDGPGMRGALGFLLFGLAALGEVRAVDESGQPVKDVQVVKTAQRMAVRAPGFETRILEPGFAGRVVLRKAGLPPLPRCQKNWDNTVFVLPEVEGAQDTQDIDYRMRLYMVRTVTGKHFLRHGWGPLWGAGYPGDHFLEAPGAYEERTYRQFTQEMPLTIARGRTAGGKLWRMVGVFGETIEYETSDPEAARKLDVWMDRVCVAR
jgi:hypothetical protein